ncbi:MAG: thrombospondin type 3 repeat-containing protein, partial [Pseudomonadota bacterium]
MNAHTTRHALTCLLAGLVLSVPAAAEDRDGDGIDNAVDNCLHVANPGQWDADADGIGSRCDPDFNNNGIVDDYDVGYLRDRLFRSDPVADLNRDGQVDFVDLAIVRAYYGAAPGGVPRSAPRSAAGGEARIVLQPTEVAAQVGDRFTLDVILDFSGVTTIGGGFDIAYDSAMLDVVMWTPAPVGDPAFQRLPDDLDGLLAGISVGDFDVGITGVQTLGTLEFERIAAGMTAVLPLDTETVAGPFVDFDTFEVLSVLYSGSDVTDEPTQNPVIVVEPGALDLGMVSVGDTATASVLVTNAGLADLVIGNVAEGDGLAPPFELMNDDCSGRTFVFGTGCSLFVVFSPEGEVPSMDSFDIPSNAVVRPVVTVPVSGEGIGPPEPRIAFKGAASPLDLG